MKKMTTSDKTGRIPAFSPVAVFVLVSSLCFLCTVIFLLRSRGEVWIGILEENGYLYMGDFLMHLSFVNDPSKVYMVNEGSCFPPLAYLFYLFVNRILPAGESASMTDYRNMPAATLVYFGIVALSMMVIALLVYEALDRKLWLTILVSALILFSEPFFAGAIERGNSVLLVLVMLLLSLVLFEKGGKAGEWAGPLLIAACACFKLYPAVFGWLYICGKKKKETAILIISGIILFFAPFAFFNGAQGFTAFLHNLTVVGGKETLNIYTISGVIQWFCASFTSIGPKSAQLAGSVISFIWLLLVLFLTWKEKRDWKKMLYLGSLLIIFTNSSYPYTTIYLLIPFLYFLREMQSAGECNKEKDSDTDNDLNKDQNIGYNKHRFNETDIFYAVCFGLYFTTFYLPLDGFIQLFGQSFAFLERYIVLYIMLVVAVISSLLDFVRIRSRA